MGAQKTTRRQFIGQASKGLGSAWLAANWPAILAAREHAQAAVESGAPSKFEFFTPEQAREVDAIAAQIIPTDSTPGAREAGVIHFIDRALTTFDSEKQKAYTEGLAQWLAKVKELYPAVASFADASSEQQIEVLKSLEKSDFFGTVRTHTLMGFLCLPDHDGNRGGVGWKLIGMEDAHFYSPPFGYYDRDYPGWEAGKMAEESTGKK
jgi:gluconate 2-dehydrogenase gamma chain